MGDADAGEDSSPSPLVSDYRFLPQNLDRQTYSRHTSSRDAEIIRAVACLIGEPHVNGTERKL